MRLRKLSRSSAHGKRKPRRRRVGVDTPVALPPLLARTHHPRSLPTARGDSLPLIDRMRPVPVQAVRGDPRACPLHLSLVISRPSNSHCI